MRRLPRTSTMTRERLTLSVPLVKLAKLSFKWHGKTTVPGVRSEEGMRRRATEPDIPLEAVQSLLTRVIWQAVADLSVETYRTESERFFAGETFVEYCDILGWNVGRARASLGRFVQSGSRISGSHLLTAAELAAQRVSAAPAVAV